MNTSHSLTRTFTTDVQATQNWDGTISQKGIADLMNKYNILERDKILTTSETLKFSKKLGIGGQGVVYQTIRNGADGFVLPVALKIFSPKNYSTQMAYDQAMARLARVSAQIAMIQHDNLLNVNHWMDYDGIRIMEMECIDGIDLSRIQLPSALEWIRNHCSTTRYEHLKQVLLTTGAQKLRFQVGAAITIVYDCLMGLAALHRERIVHSDVKPSNIMIKRTGSAKIIDTGSAFSLDDAPKKISFTPAYVAPEVMEDGYATPKSDMASVGYVLLEMLTGKMLFTRSSTCLTEKRNILKTIDEILPENLRKNRILLEFCKKLTNPDPAKRFESCEEAAMSTNEGASAILRQLVVMNLACEYKNDMRICLEDLQDFDE